MNNLSVYGLARDGVSGKTRVFVFGSFSMADESTRRLDTGGGAHAGAASDEDEAAADEEDNEVCNKETK
jgi:hypothetical protein